MKKLFVFVFIGIAVGSVLFFVTKNTTTTNHEVTILSDTTNSTTRLPTNTQTNVVIENPQTISIPKLGIESKIEHAGLDEKKNMDIPKDYLNVAWYKLGFKPGENGSAVIAGHFDTPQGEPGVFYRLSILQIGDEIIIQGVDGTLTYTVTDSQVYKFDEVPLEKVFNSTDKKRLNLITCDGIFDKNLKNYSNRLIVYAEMIEN